MTYWLPTHKMLTWAWHNDSAPVPLTPPDPAPVTRRRRRKAD